MYHTQVAWPYQSSAVQCQLLPEGAGNPIIPKMDIFETRDEIVYIFEMPGINDKQLEVTSEGRNIVINAPILTIDPQECSYRYQERSKGLMMRVVSVVPDADLERVKAELKNGLLELRFSKTTGNTFSGRRIPVHSAQ
ncbi:MAG TPA: Hsp20/alpha crystallin family protein [Clostridia bacterium]|jgi:HSP20 family molecular chaperone IbpA|nr:Hsp20/alpha crystallin family protein [Clostridia bacterium]